MKNIQILNKASNIIQAFSNIRVLYNFDNVVKIQPFKCNRKLKPEFLIRFN